MTAAVDSTTRGCLVTVPALGLDEEDADVQGLDEGLLDGSIVVTGDNLDRFLHAYFACLIGMDGKLMRPRWQPRAPVQPARDVNWAAFGVIARRADTFAAEVHGANEDGFDETIRHEIMEILVSFYGPGADANASALRDAFQVAQNREVLQINGMGFREANDLLHVPEQVNDFWLQRVDLTVYIARAIVRQYEVLNLLEAQVGLNTEVVQVELAIDGQRPEPLPPISRAA